MTVEEADARWDEICRQIDLHANGATIHTLRNMQDQATAARRSWKSKPESEYQGRRFVEYVRSILEILNAT